MVNGKWSILALCCGIMALASCEHEIDFDFPTAEAQVVFEGCISNEGVSVRISHTRSMGDSVSQQAVPGAQVWIADDEGNEEQLYYDGQEHSYLSHTGLTGVAGHTYSMRAIVDGRHYEASSTMMPPTPIDSIGFRWIDVLNERIYFLYLKGRDPVPDARNYLLLRLYRDGEVFRWNTHSGRSSVEGKFEYDVVCATEKGMKEERDDYGKIPLRDGDILRTEVLSIDRPAWEFYQSLLYGQTVMTNAISNIRGGAQGVFMATSITRPDTLVFDRATLTYTASRAYPRP